MGVQPLSRVELMLWVRGVTSALEIMCDCLKYVGFCIIIMRLVSLGCLQHVVWGCERFRTVLG